MLDWEGHHMGSGGWGVVQLAKMDDVIEASTTEYQ